MYWDYYDPYGYLSAGKKAHRGPHKQPCYKHPVHKHPGHRHPHHIPKGHPGPPMAPSPVVMPPEPPGLVPQPGMAMRPRSFSEDKLQANEGKLVEALVVIDGSKSWNTICIRGILKEQGRDYFVIDVQEATVILPDGTSYPVEIVGETLFYNINMGYMNFKEPTNPPLPPPMEHGGEGPAVGYFGDPMV